MVKNPLSYCKNAGFFIVRNNMLKHTAKRLNFYISDAIYE